MKLFFTLALLSNLLFAHKIELEILGSGGPEIDGRASTSYLLWIDNKAKLIVEKISTILHHTYQHHILLF